MFYNLSHGLSGNFRQVVTYIVIEKLSSSSNVGSKALEDCIKMSGRDVIHMCSE